MTDLEIIMELADQGNLDAQKYLGNCFTTGTTNVKQNYKMAVKYYKMAAEQGDSLGQVSLGLLYYKGTGVEQNYEIAVKYYKMAAEQGDSSGQLILGTCYYNGTGVEQNYETAVKYYRMSAEQGNADAQACLGICYYDGIGVEQNKTVAAIFLINAAEQGNKEAQRYAGEYYLKGIETNRDFKKAEYFFKKAYENGCEECAYYTKIFAKLNGRRIQIVNDISEEIDEENVGAVLIIPKENNYEFSHTLYDIVTYKLIKERVREILKDVEELNSNRDNEFEIFMKIYIKLGKLIAYNHEQANTHNSGVERYNSSNLIGGLLEGKCVCARIFRNTQKCNCM